MRVNDNTREIASQSPPGLPKRRAGLFVVTLVILTAACGESPEDQQTTALPRVADPAPMARMTSAQYNNTIRDLFAPARITPLAFPSEAEGAGGFRNNVTFNAPTGPLVEAYHRAALSVAEQVGAQIEEVVGCAVGSLECGHEYLAGLAVRAWRRDLDDTERRELLAEFDDWAAQHGWTTAMQLAIEQLLMSPQFLYLARIGHAKPDATGVGVPLSSWELAARLSYFLWNSTPDEQLLELARADKLRDRKVVIEQAWRMLGDPRGLRMVVAFHGELLDFEGVSSVGVDLDYYHDQGVFDWLGEGYQNGDDVSDFYFLNYLPMLRYEPEVFIAQEIFGGGPGTLAGLLTSSTTYVTPHIARLAYDSAVDELGPAVTWTAYTDFGTQQGEYENSEIFEAQYYPLELDPGRRAGILTLASFLSSHAGPQQPSPVGRGVAILDRLLCRALAPPGDVPPLEQSLEGHKPKTNREKYAIHEQSEACAGCHRTIDGIGLVFEHYDSLGRWRDLDNGYPVDASGELVIGDTAGPVDGAVELAHALAHSRDVHDCYVRQWFRWGFGRNETSDDSPTLEGLQAGFWESGGDIQELIINIAASHEFRYRSAP